ncbi:MAG TPA: hypothetical protein VNL35_13340 [Chloroflexota bacterium]|nr:hypothetical protein [Chloroflexota bacterium]
MSRAASSVMRAGAFSSWCEWSWRRPTARRHSHGGQNESDHGTAPAALMCPDHPVEHSGCESKPGDRRDQHLGIGRICRIGAAGHAQRRGERLVRERFGGLPGLWPNKAGSPQSSAGGVGLWGAT